jgi:SAM-dependent methyltransferase
MTREILDACCGGRMWWWDKNHPLAIYMDVREAPRGTRENRPNWCVEPDITADFRAIPFDDDTFRLVLFDPPHIIRNELLGNIGKQYGALPRTTEQDTLRQGLTECWRVLAPGGTLIFKWSGEPARVRPHFPAVPIVGTRAAVRRAGGALPTSWFVFYKPVEY